MNPIRVFIETGEKKTFSGALDYPGWCRSGKDETSALQALLAYGARYAQVLEAAGIDFQQPISVGDFAVVERHAGNTTTDFGSPAVALESDHAALEQDEYARLRSILLACWDTFEAVVQRAQGRELRKGPRGGGRDLDEISAHVLDAEAAYLNKLGWKYNRDGGTSPEEALNGTRQAVLSAMQAAFNGGLPAQGPRGGARWPLRYYMRRSAWHLLDHAWEIEDRVG
jgi:hypothetical protein